MDFNESSEHEMLRSSVAQLAESYGHKYWVDKAKRREFASELWNDLGKLGFLGVSLPETYGGGGMGLTELAIVVEELAAAGCPQMLLLVSPSIAGMVIAKFGTEAQKTAWLPGIADGSVIVAMALTEPNAGSNTHQISTRAQRQGGDYVISGSKYFITGVRASKYMLVLARTDTSSARGLSMFIVPSDAPGIIANHLPVEVLEPEEQNTLFFDDVRVPADHLVGNEGDGLRELFVGLNTERILSAATTAGFSRYAVAKAKRYAVERKVWGVPIGSHQGVAHPLAEAAIQAETARLMLQKACWLYDTCDDNKAVGEASNMAKFVNAEACLTLLDTAIQVHGGNGLATETGLATIWWLARLQRTAPVSREMVLNHFAQETLGLPRSY